MSIGIANIERACGPILVGVSTIQIIDPADVVTMPRRGISGLYESELVLRAGAQLHTIEADPGTISFSEEVRDNDAGDTYQQTVAYRLRKLRPVVASHVERLRNNRVHLILTDFYGQKLWLPYMRLKHRSENGPRGGRNYLTPTWQSLTSLPTAYLAAQVITQAGDVLVGAIVQSPDNSYWRISVGLCGEPIAIATTSNDVIASSFRISDAGGNPYLLSVDNHGTISIAASAGEVGELIIASPTGDKYLFAVDAICETLLTIRQNSDLPGGGNENLGG